MNCAARRPRAHAVAAAVVTESDVAAAHGLHFFVDEAIAVVGDGGADLASLADAEVAAAAIAWARRRRAQVQCDARLEAAIAAGKVERLAGARRKRLTQLRLR